jgi:hypothetical protein
MNSCPKLSRKGRFGITAFGKGVVVTTFCVALLVGIVLVNVPVPGASSSTSGAAQNASPIGSAATQSTNMGSPPGLGKSCTLLPGMGTNSSSDRTFAIALSNPTCGYYLSSPKYGGTVGFVGNESFDVNIQGAAISAIALGHLKVPFGAAWFSSPSVITDAIGQAHVNLFLAGMFVNPEYHVPPTDRVKFTAASSGLELSVALPVVESSTVSGLNPTGLVAFPSRLVMDSSFHANASYRTPFGVVYLPNGVSSPANINLSLKVVGLAGATNGSVLPMPSWLHVWFTDFQGNPANTFTLSPYREQFIFLNGNNTLDLTTGTSKSYPVAIQVTENGQQFSESALIVIEHLR